MNSLLIPQPDVLNGFFLQYPASKGLPKGFPSGDLDIARLAYRQKVESWKTLELRQTFADEDFMRDHIKAAGLRSPHKLEPAKCGRLRHLLSKAGVSGKEVREAVGGTLENFLVLNPSLPLWAALALVLEATGKFTRQAFAPSLGDGA